MVGLARVVVLVAVVTPLLLPLGCGSSQPAEPDAATVDSQVLPGEPTVTDPLAATPSAQPPGPLDSTSHSSPDAAPLQPPSAEFPSGADSVSAALAAVEQRGPYFKPGIKPKIDGEITGKVVVPQAEFEDTSAGKSSCDSVALSPDGRLVASGYYNGAIHIWAAQQTPDDRDQTIPPLAILKAFPDNISALAFSADGKLIAAGDGTSRVVVRDVERGGVLFSVKRDHNAVSQIAFSSDGRYLCYIVLPYQLRMLNARTGQQLWTSEHVSASFSPSGDTIVVGKYDSLEVRNSATGAVAQSIDSSKFPSLEGVAFNPNGEQIAISYEDDKGRKLSLYDLKSSSVQTFESQSTGKPQFLPGGKVLMLSNDRVSEFWLLPAGKRLCEFEGIDGAVALASKGGLIATEESHGCNVFDISLLFNFPVMRAIEGLGKKQARFHVERDVLAVKCERLGEDFKLLGELQAPLAVDLGYQEVSDADLALLAATPNIVELNFENCKGVTDANLAALANLPNLRRLKLYSNKEVTDASAAMLSKLTKLKVLDLSFTGLTSDSLKQLEVLTALEKFKPPYGLTDEGLASIAKLKNLTALETSGSSVTDAGLAHLAGLTKLESLKTAGEFTGSGLAHLAGMQQLKSLDLGGCSQLTDDGFAALPTLPMLARLSLAACDNLTAAIMPTIGKLSNLEELDLSRSEKMTAAGLPQLTGLKKLAVIRLDYCKTLTGEGLEALAEHPQVVELDLRGTALTDEGLRRVAAITQLKKLWINEGATDEGLKQLANLPHLEELSYYELPKVHGAGLVAVAKARGFAQLHLQETGVTDQDLAQFAEVTSLRRIDLPKRITAAGFAAVSKIASLEHIDTAHECRVDDECLKHLAQLPRLKNLSISTSKVTVEGLKQIQDNAPFEYLYLGDSSLSSSDVDDFLVGRGKFAAELHSVKATESSFFAVPALAFSPDGKSLACSTFEEDLKMLDVASREWRFALEKTSLRNAGLDFMPDGKTVVTSGPVVNSAQPVVWIDTQTGKVTSSQTMGILMQHPDELRIAASGPRLIGKSYSDLIIDVIPSTGKPISQSLGSKIEDLDVDSTGEWLVCSQENQVSVWNVASATKKTAWRVEGQLAPEAGISKGGVLVAHCEGDDRIVVRDTASGKILWHDDLHFPKHVRFSADGTFLAVVNWGRNMTVIYEAKTGRRLRNYRGYKDHIDSLDISRDGKLLATGGDDGLIKLWDMPTLP